MLNRLGVFFKILYLLNRSTKLRKYLTIQHLVTAGNMLIDFNDSCKTQTLHHKFVLTVTTILQRRGQSQYKVSGTDTVRRWNETAGLQTSIQGYRRAGLQVM